MEDQVLDSHRDKGRLEKVDHLKEPKDLLVEMEVEGLNNEEEVDRTEETGRLDSQREAKVRREIHHEEEEGRLLLEEDLNQSRTTKLLNWRI